jgi:anti-anti-sigma regulatory factor
MGDIQLKDKAGGKGKVLKLEGALTIETVLQLKEVLLEAYEAQDALEMDVRTVESMDLASAQLLCSARRSFHQAGRDITFAGEMPDGIRVSLKSMAIDSGMFDSASALACSRKEGDRHE